MAFVPLLFHSYTSKPCEGVMADKCVECTEDNRCLFECKTGYFIEPFEEKDTGAYCSACQVNCLSCTDKKKCDKCAPGFLKYPNECIRCDTGCSTCEEKPTMCVNCLSGYLLDTEKECYYRYTLVIMIASALGIFLFFSLLCRCLMNVNKPDRQSIKLARALGETHESILGDEFKKDPTIISDVTGIGKQHEVDEDLSMVEESQVGGGGGHDDSIHIDEFNSRRNSQVDSRRHSIDDRKHRSNNRNDPSQRATVPNNNYY